LHDLKSCKLQSIQSNANKRAQVFLFARIFYNITFAYKLKHLRFQLTRNENCKEHLDQARRLLRVLTPNSDPNRGRCPKGCGGGKCLIVGTPRRSLFCSHVFSYKTAPGVVRKKQPPASVRSYVIILPAVFLLCKQAIAPGATRRYAPRGWRSKNRGGSTSVRGRVRSPHISGGRRWLSCRQPACL